MKKLFILLLISVNCYSQKPYVVRDYIRGRDTTNAGFLNVRTVFVDTLNNICWYKQALNKPCVQISCTGWVYEKGADGKDGANGSTPIFQTGSVTTLQPNTPATGLVRSLGGNNYAIDLGVPQGIQGIPGQDGGGGGSIAGFVSPDSYGAVHANKTFSQDGKNQAYIDANYGGFGLTTSSQIDRAALLKTFANSSKKGVVLNGTYYVDNSVLMAKLNNTVVYGNFAIIQTVNSNTFDVLTRPTPVDLNEANAMENYTLTISNLIINCSGSQVGLRSQPSFQNLFESIHVYGGATGFVLQFNLLAWMTNCRVNNAINGAILTWGGFNGANKDNSQTNYTVLENFRTHTVSGIGVGIYDTYGVRIDGAVFEGNGTINRCIEYKAGTSTTTKDLEIYRYHFEQTGGCSDVQIYADSRDANIYISNAIAHYQGLFLDAQSTTGQTNIILERINWLVPKTSNGKLFRCRVSGTNLFPSWAVNYCNFTTYSQFPTLFESNPPHTCGSIGCGYNGYAFSLPIR